MEDGGRTEVDIAFMLAPSFLHARALAGHASVGRSTRKYPWRYSIVSAPRRSLCFVVTALHPSIRGK